MVDKYGVANDPYCYPQTEILINNFDIRSADILEDVEAELTTIRLEQFHDSDQVINFEYFKAIHFHLFQDLYTWAGQIRTVDISKGDTRFCNVARIEKEGSKCFSILSHLDNLSDSNSDEFIAQLTDFFCEMNVVHPFREGNGRALRLLCEVIAKRSGFILSWNNISPKQWMEANIAGYHGDLTPLIKIFSNSTRKIV
ncbi:putative adenosine monophosphate-protein transferase Fic [Thalassotalea sp. LPB0316]|uniref:putative adenosine monophosphate-protein transferase Fic n=1 Tax=Thalassotalea sp. LPB0316 TaxID=2769490 RepID=UPI001867BB6F|nr:putative adenosine monophosphate-protein transferase Fic [Thalassotalea sp. LPB0316]QOL26175.1 putative adenosine monophosphate-protein transferase Fic [Thalassotalea sp. LPB0316]